MTHSWQNGTPVTVLFRVDECRGCGRSYYQAAPVDWTHEDGHSIRCSVCGSTTRTDVEVTREDV